MDLAEAKGGYSAAAAAGGSGGWWAGMGGGKSVHADSRKGINTPKPVFQFNQFAVVLSRLGDV